MLTHTYPHKPPEEDSSDHMQSPGWQPTFCVAWCLMICKFRKSVVIHDTECPYWDHTSLNNTNQNQNLSVLFFKLLIFHLVSHAWIILIYISNLNDVYLVLWNQITVTLYNPYIRVPYYHSGFSSTYTNLVHIICCAWAMVFPHFYNTDSGFKSYLPVLRK